MVSGGDVAAAGRRDGDQRAPDAVSALHLTDVPYSHLISRWRPGGSRRPTKPASWPPVRQWQRSEGAYAHEQSTKPHTLAVALGDSPAGLLAWIVEKLRSWSDCGGDVETVFPREDLLTWVTAYWVTGTIGTSFTPYVEPRGPVEPVEVTRRRHRVPWRPRLRTPVLRRAAVRHPGMGRARFGRPFRGVGETGTLRRRGGSAIRVQAR